MTIKRTPRLCGGTFFTLLLQARKQRIKARQRRQGERDGLSDTDMLVGLLKVFNPDYIEPTATTINTFKTNTSDYKSCRISSGTYLPLDDTAVFDGHVRNDYTKPLQAMCGFVDRFIDAGTSTEKDARLVKALLELLDTDQSIMEEQVFYAYENGSPITKATLRYVTDVTLQSFLLGVWHFILVNRKDNTVGRATYDAWCPPGGGAERKYAGTMGDGITRTIHITILTAVDVAEDDCAVAEDAPFINRSEPHAEQPGPDPVTNTTTQIINSPAVFFNSGANGMQINNTGTLIIDRGGKHAK